VKRNKRLAEKAKQKAITSKAKVSWGYINIVSEKSCIGGIDWIQSRSSLTEYNHAAWLLTQLVDQQLRK
jgi:hypothetical protein